MARNKREPRGKIINPTFFVFCEGVSEDLYVRHLRTKYRIPVEIVPKITKNQVGARMIKESIKNLPQHEKDKIFLMYDIDVDGFLSKLESIKKDLEKETPTEIIASNPCFELWYIYHYSNQTAEINTENCIKKLHKLCPDYKKGNLSFKLKEKLEKHQSDAIKKAKTQTCYKNPSTIVYLLINELEQVKKHNNK
jgi:hypothetical protein